MIRFILGAVLTAAALLFVMPLVPGFEFTGSYLLTGLAGQAICALMVGVAASAIIQSGRALVGELFSDLVHSNHRFPSFFLCTAASAALLAVIPGLLIWAGSYAIPSLLSATGFVSAFLAGLPVLGIFVLINCVSVGHSHDDDEEEGSE